jgi:hypothetical protein
LAADSFSSRMLCGGVALIWLWGFVAIVGAVVGYDVTQKKHAILRNFPIIGHSRYLLEAVGYQKGWEMPSAEDTAALRVALGGGGDSGEPVVYAEP